MECLHPDFDPAYHDGCTCLCERCGPTATFTVPVGHVVWWAWTGKHTSGPDHIAPRGLRTTVCGVRVQVGPGRRSWREAPGQTVLDEADTCKRCWRKAKRLGALRGHLSEQGDGDA